MIEPAPPIVPPAEPSPMHTLDRGRAAEEIAQAYLKLQGYQPLMRGYRAGKAEVDLVMQHGDSVVFVEVKLRGPGSLARGAEAITRQQQARLEAAGASWLMRHGLTTLRFDAVLLDEDAEGMRLTHIKGAFQASRRRPI